MDNTVDSSKPEKDASASYEPPAKRARLPESVGEEGQAEKTERASEAQEP